MKRKTVRADEVDLVCGMRHYLCYMGRPGVTSGIKRRMRRRERREARIEIGEGKREAWR